MDDRSKVSNSHKLDFESKVFLEGSEKFERVFSNPFFCLIEKKPSSFRFVSELQTLEGTVSTFNKQKGREWREGRTGNETDVQTRRSISCILPCRSPLNYTEAFYRRLKRELIKLAAIFCRIKKKKKRKEQERELPGFLRRTISKNCGSLVRDNAWRVFSPRKFFLEKEGRRFVEFLWQRNRWKSSRNRTKLLRFCFCRF